MSKGNLEKYQIQVETQPSTQPPRQQQPKPRKSRYETPLVLSSPTGLICTALNIPFEIVGANKSSVLTQPRLFQTSILEHFLQLQRISLIFDKSLLEVQRSEDEFSDSPCGWRHSLVPSLLSTLVQFYWISLLCCKYFIQDCSQHNFTL